MSRQFAVVIHALNDLPALKIWMADSEKENSSCAGAASSADKQKRSEVWLHFTSTSDGVDWVERKKCGKRLKYVRGTTNMREHRRRYHEFETASGQQLTMARLLDKSKSTCPVGKTNYANQLLVHWLWSSLRPLSVVSDQSLQDLLAFLEPGYRLPSRTFVARQLRVLHQEGKTKLNTVLSGCEGISITSDIWTSRATQAFNTTTTPPQPRDM